jgi:hypothetical protein
MRARILNYINLDKFGIALSGLCALHCVLTPLVILSLPIMGRYYLAHPYFHVILALFILPVGFAAFISGYRHHHNPKVFAFGVPGLLIITLVPFLVHRLGFMINEPMAMLIGSVLLIVGHWINRRTCACDAHSH